MADSAQVFKITPPSTLESAKEREWYVHAMEKLVGVVQELSHARTIPEISAIVRQAARELTGADGATFVLREGEQCYYADENAIAPLWKGSRFPLKTCISGWSMLNKQAVAIEDIYKDSRIPIDAYRPTFVKSLVMVPIRREHPIGAIGNYWAKHHHVSDAELVVLQALADTTSVAMENVQLYTQLQSKIKALQESNNDLSKFAWIASHDLQEPLRNISTQVELLARKYQNALDTQAHAYIQKASKGAIRLQNLIKDLLTHSQSEKADDFQPVSLAEALSEALQNLQISIEETHATIKYDTLPWIWGDKPMLVRLFQNLLSNALKFHREGTAPDISITCDKKDGFWIACVKDHGIGIESEYHESVFGLFNRLHSQDVYPGSGLGLSTCKKIVEIHNGSIWLYSTPGEGTSFFIKFPMYHYTASTVEIGKTP